MYTQEELDEMSNKQIAAALKDRGIHRPVTDAVCVCLCLFVWGKNGCFIYCFWLLWGDVHSVTDLSKVLSKCSF